MDQQRVGERCVGQKRWRLLGGFHRIGHICGERSQRPGVVFGALGGGEFAVVQHER